MCLDREDLLALKGLHCARVAEEEAELFSLLRFPKAEDKRRIQHLREMLNESYLSYEASFILKASHFQWSVLVLAQDQLEAAQPHRSTAAVLAHRILLADAYFFHARIEGRFFTSFIYKCWVASRSSNEESCFRFWKCSTETIPSFNWCVRRSARTGKTIAFFHGWLPPVCCRENLANSPRKPYPRTRARRRDHYIVGQSGIRWVML